MDERLLLIEHSIALLLLFTAIGSGPAVGLIRDRRFRLVTMPILGFALAASLLTSASLFLPLATAAWSLLIPIAVLSVAAAAVIARRFPATSGRTREIAAPTAALVVGVVIALMPPILRGTQGPFALAVDDSWGYAATSLFLEHHRATESLPAQTARVDATTYFGSGNAHGYARIGVDSVNAAAATLFRADTGAMLAPLLAVLFGLVPVLVWLVVRGLGGSWPAAALAAALGLTPAILSMVEDTALGNLAGEVLAAPVLFFAARSLQGSRLNAVVAGLLLGGLLAVYPEFLLPVVIVAACGGLLYGINRLRRGERRELAHLAAVRVGILSVTAIAVAPYAAYRAVGYLSSRGSDGPWAQGLPTRGIDVQNVGAWAFGLLHLYQMPGASSLPAAKLAFATYYPALLAGVVVVGVVTRARIFGAFVAAPIVVAGVLGISAYESYQNGHCEYCLWKSLTFMSPFLVAGLAFGIEWLWLRAGTRRAVCLRRGFTGAVAIVALVAVGRSDSKLIQTTRSNGGFCPCQFRDLSGRLDKLPTRAPLLIEGVGSMGQPQFMMPATYFAVRGHKERVAFDAGFPAVQYLGLSTESAAPYYTPGYEYVLTPYGDMRSNRKPLGRYGPLLLERRAPIDVVVSSPDWTVDSAAPRIPWVSKPFRLRVSSGRALDAAITFSLARPAGSASALTFTAGRRQLETVATNRSEVCVNVHLQKGSTNIEATPVLDPLALPPSWMLEKELGLAAVTAVPGRCGAGRPVPAISFSDGWFPAEMNTDGSHIRWMGSVATIEIGLPGTTRPRVRMKAQLSSFLRRRRVDVWLGNDRLDTVDAPKTGAGKLALVVPSGQGVARLLLVSTPDAAPASIVSPGDTRLLSVALTYFSIRTDATASSQP